MHQKIIQVGNSLAVTLPSAFVKKSKVKAGQTVFVEADSDIDTVRITTNPKVSARFLFLNGRVLDVDDEDFVDFPIRVEQKKLEIAEIALWFSLHVKK